jgi:methyl-accepting chemotaxis protein
VIKVITSIAQQTNLLALNATIEAARAGEAGKGFAVVANEVKELAKETAKATEDISRKIEAIQADTQGAVEAIARISGIINQISDIQNTIASAVEEQSATTNEIGRNISEASKGSTEIAQNIGGKIDLLHDLYADLVVAQDRNSVAALREQRAAELLLVDEKRGRRIAIDRGLEVTGLLGHFGGADHRTSWSAPFRERWQGRKTLPFYAWMPAGIAPPSTL